MGKRADSTNQGNILIQKRKKKKDSKVAVFR